MEGRRSGQLSRRGWQPCAPAICPKALASLGQQGQLWVYVGGAQEAGVQREWRRPELSPEAWTEQGWGREGRRAGGWDLGDPGLWWGEVRAAPVTGCVREQFGSVTQDSSTE